MAAAGTFIPKIFEEHLETAGLLWERRRAALRSPEYTASDIRELDDVIDAHVEGLGAAGEDAVPVLKGELLGDDPARAFAAAFALLHVGLPDALASVCDAFATAKDGKLDALRDALAHGPATPLSPQLMSLFLSSPPPVAAAAAEVLTFHGAIQPGPEHLERLIRADDSGARAGAWRIAAYCGISVPSQWYDAGLCDDDVSVRRAVLETAAWNRSPGFYTYARSLAEQPTPESVDLVAIFAAVAPPEEYRLVAAVASNPNAGPGRHRVVASFGHPYFIPFLIDEMSKLDPVAAACAAAAFERMTGRAVDSKLKNMESVNGVPPRDGAEAAESGFVPDPDSARKHWTELAPHLGYVPRIARGVDVSRGVSPEAFDTLDMESRWEYCLRMRLFGGWHGTPLVLERYPQRF
ncbi:MAG: hypothetical protein ABR499_02355 [Gemmatimonadaceae bacterium]